MLITAPGDSASFGLALGRLNRYVLPKLFEFAPGILNIYLGFTVTTIWIIVIIKGRGFDSQPRSQDTGKVLSELQNQN